MTVYFRKHKHTFKFWISLRFACFISLIAAKKSLKKKGVESNVYGRAQARAVYKGLKRAKKDFGKLEIVGFTSAGGAAVKVTL